MLEGKKTYISAALIGIATALKIVGVIDNNTFEAIIALFVAPVFME